MPTPQPGILQPLPPLSRYLVFALEPDTDVAAGLKTLVELVDGDATVAGIGEAPLSAIGRSVWREGGVAHWLASVRQAVQKRLSLRYPKLTQQDASEQRIALARIAACKTIDIASAMTAGRAQSTNEFCKAMQILQRLDQRL